MCDTVVATAQATVDGVPLFGKNSDREPNEAHHLLHIPAADHVPGEPVQCTYIEIPQVEHTYAVLLAKPFWIWGAEMGANEHGLVIGNEAVFTKMPRAKEPGLIGMDLLRLALERSASAREAVTVITELIATHGLGGNCGFQRKLFYHNSFLLADPRGAWVLETAGRHWVAKEVQGVYTISNGLTIGREWDLASPDIVDHAVEKGWCKDPADFDFARCYADFLYTTLSDSRRRRARTMELLDPLQGDLTVSQIMQVLRDHGDIAQRSWRPDRGLIRTTVCMHAAFGPVRYSQTTGSMVSHLHPDHPTHFFTGTAAPCTGFFKPCWPDAPIDLGPAPTETYDAATLFWRHETLHRAILRNYATSIQVYRTDRDALEREFISGALERALRPAEERAAFSAAAFQQALEAEQRWLERLAYVAEERPCWLYSLAWRRRSRQAQMPEESQALTNI